MTKANAIDIKKAQRRIQELETERAEIFAEIEPKQARMLAIYEEIKPLRELISLGWMEEMGDNPDWKTIARELADGPRSSIALLRYAERQLREKFDMYHGGYWSETQEANFQIKIEKTAESLIKNYTGVKFFAQILKPHPDGYVWFGIFEHSLSAHGSYTLRVKPDLSEAILMCRNTDIEDFDRPGVDNVLAACQHIQKHHWYGESEERYADSGDEGH